MPSTVHQVARYSVQVLNTRTGDHPKASMIVRLYSNRDETCGVAVFKDYGGQKPDLPSGDTGGTRATAYYDITFYQPFIDILRTEDELYWKIAWIQTGPNRRVSDVSLDTKKEIIGEFFTQSD